MKYGAMSSAPKSGEFNEGKLWFTRKGTTLTLAGVTDQALDEVGDVRSLDLPDTGDDFDSGEAIAVIRGANSDLELITPAAGLVQEIDQMIKAEPENLADDPTEEGWLVKLEIQDVSDLKAFVDDQEESSEDSDG